MMDCPNCGFIEMDLVDTDLYQEFELEHYHCKKCGFSKSIPNFSKGWRER